MKKTIASLLALALCLAVLAACGNEPVAVTEAVTIPEATSVTEPPTTTEAPPTTEETTTTTKVATTQKPPTTQPDYIQQQIDAINNNNNLTAREKEYYLKYLVFHRDENGVAYLERERWTGPVDGFGMFFNWQPSYGEPPRIIQMIYSTVRVKFRYGGQDWMIQMWKGRYGLVMLGGEIAVLKKPTEQPAEHYWPALESEELAISMDVYQHNFHSNKTKQLFSRSTNSAWWFNGFVPGSFVEYNRKDEIIMVGSIIFPNQEMLKAFEKSFARMGFKSGAPDHEHSETYAIDGNTLTFSWQNIDQDA